MAPESREFDKRLKHLLFGDHFIFSYNLFSLLCIENVRRKLKEQCHEIQPN